MTMPTLTHFSELIQPVGVGDRDCEEHDREKQEPKIDHHLSPKIRPERMSLGHVVTTCWPQSVARTLISWGNGHKQRVKVAAKDIKKV